VGVWMLGCSVFRVLPTSASVSVHPPLTRQTVFLGSGSLLAATFGFCFWL
jgi:hypothetical protein